VGLLVRRYSSLARLRTPGEGFSEGEMPAALVPKECRTSDNSLSFWMAADRGAVDDAVLAIIGAEQTNVDDPVDVAIVAAEDAERSGSRLVATPGRTCFESLRPLQCDLVNLDSVRIGAVGRLLATAACREESLRSYTRRELARLLKDAVDRGLHHQAQLPTHLKKLLCELR